MALRKLEDDSFNEEYTSNNSETNENDDSENKLVETTQNSDNQTNKQI